MKILFDKFIPSIFKPSIFKKGPLKTHYLGKLYRGAYADVREGWKYHHISFQFVKLNNPSSSPSIWEIADNETIFETTSLEEALFRISVLGIPDENIKVDERIYGYDWRDGSDKKEESK